MRRYVATFAVALMPLAVTACEDGPNQTYSPAPPNAGNIWNGSPGAGGLADGGAYVPGASDGFDASFGGQNANDLCTADQEKVIWAKLFQEPIQVPGLAGGIDIAGGYNGDGASGYDPSKPFTYDPAKETWTGCTVEQAQKILCQATASSIFYGTTNTVGWGEQLEFDALYNTSSRQIQFLLFEYGYMGSLSGTDKLGNTWNISLNNTLMTETNKQGQTTQLTLNWTNPSTLNPIVNGLYEALRNTYIPTFPPDQVCTAPGKCTGDCISAGHCIVGNNLSQGGYFYYPPMNLAFYVNTTVGSTAANSTPALVQLGLLKLLPFSNSANLMKLDVAGEGPTSITTNVQGTAAGSPEAAGATTCKYVLGMKFSDFDKQCVQVFNATTNPMDFATQNTIAENKLFGAMAHGDEVYAFNVVGVDPQFAASSLAPTTVVSDTQRPGPNDTAYQLVLDQNILGLIANDYQDNDVTTGIKDLHGLGEMTLLWAIQVQHYMQKAYGVTTELGDARCLNGNPYKGAGYLCSGIEGIVTTAPPAFASTQCPAAGTKWPDGNISLCVKPDQMKVNALGLIGPQQIAPAAYLAGGLQPGTWYSVICNDAGGISGGAVQGYTNCIGGSSPFQGNATYYFDTMLDAVLQTGNWGTVLSQMPPRDLGSRRFYFQQWILAAVKYFQSAADPKTATTNVLTMNGNPVDPNDLFFDTAGGGFESGEYIFRAPLKNVKQAPDDLQITTNLQTSVINDWSFGRYNFRGENAVYTALTQTAGDPPGAEKLYLTNIVGSPLLASTYSTYACAINLDPTNANCGATASAPAITGPTDPLGNPLLTGYQPAFGKSIFNIAANGSSPSIAPFTLDTVGPASGPYQLITSAMITIPIWSNPFDPTTATANDKTISALLPYLPKGSGVGFPVTIDGSRDKFYNTNNIVFTGQTLDAVMDFESVPFVTGDGGTSNGFVVRAMESQLYLGLAFACAQPNPVTGQPDLLAVRMYQNGNDLLTYLSTHPGATSACGIQIKYSIYGNYADYISSLTYGVRFGLNPGFGGSVVSDLTLFDPNVVAALGQ